MKRMDTAGTAWGLPVGDNTTISGGAMNRRVEVYITANKIMIKEAG
jgi:flagellar motor protein MotB